VSTSKDPQVRWRYLESVGEFALFWVSPFHGHEEKIATFWWPPDGARAEVEPLFRRIAERACTAPAAKRPGFFDKARVCTEDPFEPAAQAQTDYDPGAIAHQLGVKIPSDDEALKCGDHKRPGCPICRGDVAPAERKEPDYEEIMAYLDAAGEAIDGSTLEGDEAARLFLLGTKFERERRQ
jgi:hypothetical protein